MIEYAGMRHHEPSGLYLTYYRAYDPKLGRWLSRDPIGEAGGINLYGYVGCRPGSYTDPWGLYGFNDFFQDVVDLTGGCSNNSFVDDIANNFVNGQDDASLLKTRTSIVFGGAFAKQYGGLTLGGAGFGLFKEFRSGYTVSGIGSRTFVGAAGTATTTWAINFVLIKGFYDAGMLIGSFIRMGINRIAASGAYGCDK